MVKKAFIGFLCILLAATMVAGCGGPGPGGASGAAKTTEEAETAIKQTEPPVSEEAAAGETAASAGETAASADKTTAAADTATENAAADNASAKDASSENTTITTTAETTAEPETVALPVWGAGEGEGATEPETTVSQTEATEKQPETTEAAAGTQPSGSAYIPATAGPVPEKIDFSDAGLPPEAVAFPDAEWNYLGYFWARIIGCVDAEIDAGKLPEDWPEESKLYGVFFQVVCTDLIKEYTSIEGSDFKFGGPGVNNRIYTSLKPSGNIRSSFSPKAVGDVGYLNTIFAADDLGDVTQAWYKYMLKNEETDDYDYFLNYLTQMPIGGLVVNERPEGFEYSIPYSAVVSIGEWSEYIEDPTIKMRTLAYDLYPIADRDRPDFMHRSDNLYIVYLEAENTGGAQLESSFVYIDIGGSGVSKVSVWGSMDCTLYGSSLPHNKLLPGDRCGLYIVVCAEDIADLRAITIGSGGGPHGKAEIPFDFS